MLLVDILVSVLETIRAIVINNGDPISSEFLGDSCGPNNVGDCIASVIVYVIVHVAFTLTQILRDIAGNLDCIICAISKATDANYPCVAGIYSILAPITFLIEDLVKNVLSVLIKWIIAVIETIVYLMSGQFDLFVKEMVHAFELFGELIVNFAEAIWKFLLQIPVLGSILNVVNIIVSGACNFLESAINAFAAPDIDLDCPSAKKRGLMASGWIPTLYADVQAALSPTCRTIVAAYNISSPGSEEEHYELGFCLYSRYWKEDMAAQINIEGGSTSTCNYRMPGLYAKTHGGDWSMLNDEERALTMTCNRARGVSLTLRKDMPFVPHDIVDNYIQRVPDFIEQMSFSYGAYQQYRQDRLLPLNSVLSADNAANWQTAGYSTVHLDALRTMSTEDAEIALTAADDETLPELTVAAYAQRAVANDPNSGLWSSYRRRSVDQVSSAMQFFDDWVGTGTARPGSLKRSTQSGTPKAALYLYNFTNFMIDRMAKYRILPPPSFNLTAITDMNATKRIPYGYIAMSGLVKDVPAIAAKVIQQFRDQNLMAKAYVGGQSVAQLIYAASIGTMGIVRDMFHGALYQADLTRYFFPCSFFIH